MAVRIGKIDLVGLSRVSTEDTRSLVKQRGPGQAGGLFQDLGREPVTIAMEGILLGDDTQAALEELRQAHARAKPLSFAADAIAGADLTHVLIADLQIRQLAGHASRFAFFLRVREYTEPPEAAGTGAAQVDAAAKADAATWQKGAVDAAAVKQDPGSLMSALADNPALVAHLSAEQLGALAGANADQLSGQDFGKLLGTVGAHNPAAVLGLVDSLKKQGRFGDLLGKLMTAGVNVQSYVKSIKIEAVIALFRTIAGFGEFLKNLKVVGEKARVVGDKIGALNLSAQFAEIADPAANHAGEPSQPAEIIGAIADLVEAIAELIQTDTFKGLVELVKELHLETIVVPILKLICTALTSAISWIGTLGRITALPRIIEPLLLHFEDLAVLTDLSQAGRVQELTDLGWGSLVEPCSLANVIISQFTRLGRISSALTGHGQVEAQLGHLDENMSGLLKTFDDYQRALAGATS